MIIKRKYSEQREYSFRDFRRGRALKLAKKIREHLRKSAIYGKEADKLEIVDQELMKKATELVGKKNYKIYDYNPFGNELGSGSLKTKRGIKNGMYVGLLGKNTDDAKKFIDDGGYIDSTGQIFLPNGRSKRVEELLHESEHLGSKGLIESTANNPSVRRDFNSVLESDISKKNNKQKRFPLPRFIKSGAIIKEESGASKKSLEDLEKLGANKEQVDLARRKYNLALESYKEQAKAYNKEFRQKLWKMGTKKKKKRRS